MPSRRNVIAGFVGAATLLVLRDSRAGQTDLDPKRFIEQLGTEAVEALTGAELSEGERERRFRDMLHRSFDLPAIGRFVLGRYWRTASEAEQQEFLRVFEDFVVQSYAARFAEYSGEQFEVQDVRQEKGKYAIVRSKVIRPDAQPVRVDWRLRERDGAFKVVDIVVEGLSMVVTQRADFASAIQSSGGEVSGLIELLRRKTGGRTQQSAAQ